MSVDPLRDTVPREPIKVRLCKTLLLASFVLAGSQSGRARDVAFQDDQLVVFHDFSTIVITEQQAIATRAFVEVGSREANSVPESELKSIHEIATHSLESKVHLVSEKQQANLLITSRMYQTTNYAIRNSKHERAHGLILLGVCKFPIAATDKDCDSLTFYYFADYPTDEIFQTVFNMWLARVFYASSK